jgi:hypothetical protein
MIKYAIAAAAVLSVLAPAAAQARTYSCIARSPTGSYGYSRNMWPLARARLVALNQCAIRTPRNRICVITGCR